MKTTRHWPTKKLLNFITVAICTCMLVFSFTPSAAFAGGEANLESAIVNNPNPNDRLHLRTKASSDSASLGKYYNGVVVSLLSDVQSGWIKVRVGNLEGYMDSSYLRFDGQTVASAIPINTIRNAGGQGLNLREKQSLNAKSLGLYSNGTQVQVLGIGDTWYHVQISGKTGFMLAEHLSPPLQISNTPSTAIPASERSGGSWNDGPTGTHKTGTWPFASSIYVDYADVNNPNPADRLHLRAEPSEKSKSLGKYYNGVRVVIEGTNPVGEWTYVSVGSMRGYMKTEYLSIDEANSPLSVMPILTVANPNTAANLQLRADKSSTSMSFGTYQNGTDVLLLGFDGEWAHVIVNGDKIQMGFMLGKYLK